MASDPRVWPVCQQRFLRHTDCDHKELSSQGVGSATACSAEARGTAEACPNPDSGNGTGVAGGGQLHPQTVPVLR